jgi:hypothetical protein
MSSRILAVSGLYASTFCNKPVPAIRLQGRWLEGLGFCIGSKVEVIENQEEIIIRVVKEVGSNGKNKIHNKHKR